MGYSVSDSHHFRPTNYLLCHRIPVKEGSPRRAGGFPGNRSSLQDVSGHPLLRFKSDIHERLQVVETKRGAITPFTGLILEWPTKVVVKNGPSR
jgi:hypothetical protein